MNKAFTYFFLYREHFKITFILDGKKKKMKGCQSYLAGLHKKWILLTNREKEGYKVDV